MIRRSAVLALAISLLAATPVHERSASPSIGVSTASAQEVPAASQPTEPELRPWSGLPQRAPEPRTMRDKWPVFAGFALTWIAIVGYALTVGTSLGRIARQVQAFESAESSPR